MWADALFRVGTSGYSYFWNKGKPSPFEWYLSQCFNTVEINASFYRFPTPKWINIWKKAPTNFDFSIKTHRSITHYTKLGEKAPDLWKRFKKQFTDLNNKISFWLFQFPSNFKPTDRNLEKLQDFIHSTALNEKMVLEFRNSAWWNQLDIFEKMKVTFCSVDAPKLPRKVVSTSDTIYLRLHGKTEWYSHIYTKQELLNIIRKIKNVNAKRNYVYLNNDHGMLPNGHFLLQKLLKN